MQLGLKEGNSVNEIKIHRHWSPKFCVWLGRGKKEAIGSCKCNPGLAEDQEGGSISVFGCSFIYDELLRAASMSIHS